MVNLNHHLTKFNNRFSAAFFHLLLSAIVTSIIIVAAIWLWYPMEFITATGVASIFILVIIVDACLGPALTLLVYNKKKEQLRQDLLVILVIQAIALTYGTYTLANARTAYLVFAVDRFELVQANELASENIASASQERFKKLPWFGPEWIATSIPDDPEMRMQVSMDTIAGGADIAQLPKYYRDIYEVSAEIIERAKPLNELSTRSAEASRKLTRVKSKHPTAKLGYLPLTARKKDLTVIVNVSDASIVDIVDIDPW